MSLVAWLGTAHLLLNALWLGLLIAGMTLPTALVLGFDKIVGKIFTRHYYEAIGFFLLVVGLLLLLVIVQNLFDIERYPAFMETKDPHLLLLFSSVSVGLGLGLNQLAEISAASKFELRGESGREGPAIKRDHDLRQRLAILAGLCQGVSLLSLAGGEHVALLITIFAASCATLCLYAFFSPDGKKLSAGAELSASEEPSADTNKEPLANEEPLAKEESPASEHSSANEGQPAKMAQMSNSLRTPIFILYAALSGLFVGVYLLITPYFSSAKYSLSLSDYAILQLTFFLAVLAAFFALSRRRPVNHPGQAAIFSLMYMALIAYALSRIPTPFGLYCLVFFWGLNLAYAYTHTAKIIDSIARSDWRLLKVFFLLALAVGGLGAALFVDLIGPNFEVLFVGLSLANVGVFVGFLFTKGLWGWAVN